jgi:hypothetical protein
MQLVEVSKKYLQQHEKIKKQTEELLENLEKLQPII